MEDTVAPFGDVSLFGAPMQSEMPNGWRWTSGRIRTINPRGALLYVGIATAALFLVIVVGALLT